MSCIVIKDQSGNKRMVAADGMTMYKLEAGEYVAGLSPKCDGELAARGIKITDSPRDALQLLTKLDAEVGAGPGDWIKRLASPIAKLLGKKGCTSCEARRVVTNAFAMLKEKHGQAKAMEMIAELWQLSFKQQPETVLVKLDEYLNA